jgi:sugar (pentulose or hexulose) kinase
MFIQERIPIIAIFDVGKTNKKLFLFDEQYRVVFERSARFTETVDEDGDPCENLDSLRLSIFDSLREVFNNPKFELKAINFTSYGASFLYIDEDGNPLTPLYNYLKSYPVKLKDEFYLKYGGEEDFSVKTASPVLGSLNSGMQLYRLKQEQPEIFDRVKFALHLPQYLSYLISGKTFTDKTSLGCHTNLWDFHKNDYHNWVKKEDMLKKMAPIMPTDYVSPSIFPGNDYKVGVGLHDSSAALIPYLIAFKEPFILLSTGTWSISLNPFNQQALTLEQLADDSLCYLQYEGKAVKASRLFSGFEYEKQIKRISAHFKCDVLNFRNVSYDTEYVAQLLIKDNQQVINQIGKDWKHLQFIDRNLDDFKNETLAYYRLMMDLVHQQYHSTKLIMEGIKSRRIFVDGGFSLNSVFMNLLANAFPHIEVYATNMPQATALGAALVIHKAWNSQPLPTDIINLKLYSPIHISLSI